MVVKCEVCQEQEFKYKCPKCGIKYCSLKCYKSESHVHEVKQTVNGEVDPVALKLDKPENQDTEAQGNVDQDSSREEKVLQKILDDPQISYLLKQPALQFHISVIYDILTQTSLTQEYNKETRYEVASKKLTQLRDNGVEQNELVEEFCQRVIELLNESA